MKECALWAWWCGLSIVGTSTTLPNDGGKHGIGSLTRDFIHGLETDYPATVSTIARTCAKLAPKEASNNICVLCGRPAQQNVQAWKAKISIRSYHEAALAVSGNTRPPHLTNEEIMNLTTRPVTNNTVSLSSSSSTAQPQSLTPLLCYACHTTLTSRGTRGGGILPQSPDGQLFETTQALPLPMWVHDHGIALQKTKLTEKEMKSEIGEFLLPDE
jgi:cytoplasmic tRNA 2-thiolation protein 2